MSATYKRKPDDSSTWTEIFSPDRDIVVEGFELSGVNVCQNGKNITFEGASSNLVRFADQQLNPDYPRTIPRGGTGKVKRVQ